MTHQSEAPSKILGKGSVIGKPAPDFSLTSDGGGKVRLSDILPRGPVMLVFYPNDFTMVCTRQLCSYQGSFDKFSEFGVQILGISSNATSSHQKFSQQYKFTFPLLEDPGHAIAKAYGCASLLMLGNMSRAVFVLNTKGMILYRYVEATTLTHRSPEELLGVLADLRTHGLI